MSTRPPLPERAVAMLACPVCVAGPTATTTGLTATTTGLTATTTGLTATTTGLRCAAGHAFDRARQGHVTLLPPGHRPPSGDTAGMVADRWEFLAAGHFAGLTAALAEAALAGPPPETLLDLGGGTGQHLAGVLDRAPDAVGLVVDSSPYAARRAARVHPRAMAVVADTWAPLPVRDAAVDRVLVVFAPRNGPEIARVLRPGGRLVVVTPAADHLAEIVGPLGLLRVDPDKAGRLAGTLEPHLRRCDSSAYRTRLSLDRPAVVALVGMGPHAHHVTRPALEAAVGRLAEPVEVTVAVDLTCYTR